MVFLTNLPFEILSNIFSRLPRRHLLKVCRVSRALHAVAESILYKSPQLTPFAHFRFLQTLLTPGREVLATYVLDLTVGSPRSLKLAAEANESFLILDDSSSEDSDTESAIRLNESRKFRFNQNTAGGYSAYLKRSDVKPALVDHTRGEASLTADPCPTAAYQAALSRFELEASPCVEYLLLLNLLPHLQSLNILFPRSWNFLEPLQRLPISELPVGLQSLRHFRSREQGVCTPFFCTLLQLPHIQTVDVRLIASPPKPLDPSDPRLLKLEYIPDIWSLHEFLPVASGSSAVTALHLFETRLDTECLSHILSTPRALQTMSYQTITIYPRVDPPDMARAILPLQNTLQDLALQFEAGSAIGSLQGWPVLHTLTCPLGTLLGKPDRPLELAECLPVGIRRLEILYDDPWSMEEVVDVVVRLLQRKKDVVPLLELIGVVRDMEKCSALDSVLWTACVEAEVDLLEDYPGRYWG